MNCSKCGHSVSLTFSFCPYCGESIKKAYEEDNLKDIERVNQQIKALQYERTRIMRAASANTEWNKLLEYIKETEAEPNYDAIFDPSTVSINGVKLRVYWEDET